MLATLYGRVGCCGIKLRGRIAKAMRPLCFEAPILKRDLSINVVFFVLPIFLMVIPADFRRESTCTMIIILDYHRARMICLLRPLEGEGRDKGMWMYDGVVRGAVWVNRTLRD